MSDEKRKHHHIPVNAFVRFYPETDEPMFRTYYKGIVKNYSQGGLCIVTEHPLPKGCPVIVELPIESENQGLAIVEVRGTIRWVRQLEGRRGMGVEFHAFADSNNQDFEDWMKNLEFEE
jgi:hypothetical protein